MHVPSRDSSRGIAHCMEKYGQHMMDAETTEWIRFQLISPPYNSYVHHDVVFDEMGINDLWSSICWIFPEAVQVKATVSAKNGLANYDFDLKSLIVNRWYVGNVRDTLLILASFRGTPPHQLFDISDVSVAKKIMTYAVQGADLDSVITMLRV